MAKFLSRLFSTSSSSSKRGSFRGSQSSINETSRRTASSATMRTAASLENIASYNISQKELDKHKLHKASWEGNLNKVQRFAQPGQIDSKDQHARTALHLAVAKGHANVIQHLVHEGAKLNVVDHEQRTPLLKAVLSGNQNPPLYNQICQFLLNEGAHTFMNGVDVHGKNALHYAIEYDNEELVHLFLQYENCDPNFRDRDQMTPLHLAVKRNNPNIVYILLSDEGRHQADPNLINRNGQTPLHMAATIGSIDIIRIILQANLDEPCDPTIVDSQQLTAYQIAKANNHETCAKLIDEYQQGWTNLSPRRNDANSSINEQEINPILSDKRKGLIENDTSSDDSSSANQSSSSSSQQNNLPNRQWPDQRNPTLAQPKQETRTLADLIRSNPVQPDVPKSTPTNQTLTSMIKNNPVQPDTPKPTTTGTIKNESSSFGITPTSLPDNTSATNFSLNKGIIGTNIIVGQTATTPSSTSVPKNSTINSLVNSVPQPDSLRSNSNSWTQDSIYAQQPVRQAQRVDNTWDSSSSAQSDEDNGSFRVPSSSVTNVTKPQTLPTLNGTAMFTTQISPTDQFDESRSDEDSIEAAVKELNTQKAALGIGNLVNQQIGNTYKPVQQSSLFNLQSPMSEDSSWTTSSVTANKEPVKTTTTIQSLVKQQPLVGKKSSEPTWDDSRPLSADFKHGSFTAKNAQQSGSSTSSDESDLDDEKKSSTIVKSPLTHLVQQNIQPVESKSTGIDNLAKIMETIMHKPVLIQKQTTPPKTTISSIVKTPLIQRSDSSSSNSSSFIDDTVRSIGLTAIAATNMKQQLYHDELEQHRWSEISNGGNDFKLVSRNYSNEIVPQSQHVTPHASVHHEFNSLRGSMSSSTSSIQNNMERISELKEDIKQIERKQEDSLELKRQLKDMENKKNNFEALFKKNDQLLRETETRLEKEINEKQRLEWTTKNLNKELKSVKEKLDSLEEERNLLDTRCKKLKEEKDLFEEKVRIHQINNLQTAATGVLREEDIEKIKLRHREEMKLLSAENDDLHQRTKQLQSDLQLHKESLDVTIRYKIDLEKALEEKTYLQHELDRLKHEKDLIEQEKIDLKGRYDNLQEEIRIIVLDRSKVEQKLTNELQDQMKQRQRSTDDIKKYKTQIEQLNLKLGDAEARLLVLQTQNEALIASKDRDIKNEFNSLTQRLSLIEAEKTNAEQRYAHENKELANKLQQQQQSPAPVVLLTSNGHSHSSSCTKCDTLQRSFEQEREHRLQTERDNERLRDTVTRQKHEGEFNANDNTKQMRSETERVKYELERLRHDFDKLVSNYEPPNNYQQQAQLHSHIDILRQFYEDEFRKKQLLMSKLPQAMSTPNLNVNFHTTKQQDIDHSHHTNGNCSVCSNSRLLKERLENAIDTSLADQRIQTIKQIPILPRQNSPIYPAASNSSLSSIEILRKRYYI